MITRFHVENYKALRDVTLDLTPLHVLIGPNDSGKTSLLEAIAALSRSVDLPLNQAFLGNWSDTDLVWSGAAEPTVSLSARWHRTDNAPHEYGLSCRFGPGQQCLLTAEWIVNDQGRTDLKLISPGQSFVRWDRANPTASHPHDPTVSGYPQLIAGVYGILAGVRLHRWVPGHLALPCAIDSSRRFRMDTTGFGLVSCLDEILGYDRKRFDELEQRFRSIFPQIVSIKLVSKKAFKSPEDPTYQVPRLQEQDGKGIEFQFKGRAQLVSASQVSDGVLLVLAYLTLLYLPEPPRFLLIEEPENGIHPNRLKEVLRILRDLVESQRHTQVIMTTHSPYVLDNFGPEEVTLCRSQGDGSVATRRLSESEKVREQIDLFSLGEIWTMDGDENLMQPVSEAEGAGA